MRRELFGYVHAAMNDLTTQNAGAPNRPATH